MNKKKIAILASSIAAVLLIIAGVLIITLPKKHLLTEKSSGTPLISAGNVSAESGKAVRIPISLKNNSGIAGALFSVEYDRNMLEYTGCDNGEIFSESEAYDSKEDGKPLNVMCIADNDTEADGVMVYLNFKLSKEASGDIDIKLIFDSKSVCNYDEETITVETENGKIKVK